MDFLFPEYRLDWFGAGPSSPNKTGALLALVFVVSWWPALRFRSGFWVSLPLAFFAGGFLLQTQSRGALVSLLGSFLALVAFRIWGLMGVAEEASGGIFQKSRESVWRTCVGLVFGATLIFYGGSLGIGERFREVAHGSDGSTAVRISLYEAGLQMLSDAPQGWGLGHAGNAYAQWYQTAGDSRSYLSLVNSHLTWMAERGIFFRCAYISAWGLMFFVCMPLPWSPLRAVTFAAWVSLGISGFFSSVLTLGWLWILPVFLFLIVLVERTQKGLLPRWRNLMRCGAVCCIVYGMLHLGGLWLGRGHKVWCAQGLIELSERPARVLVIEPDRRVLGDKYGHTIREHLASGYGVAILRDSENLDMQLLSNAEILVFSGNLPDLDYLKFDGEILLLNPGVGVPESCLDWLRRHAVTVVIGGIGNWQRARYWKLSSKGLENWKYVEVSGAADFIPSWPQYLPVLADTIRREVQ